MRFPETEMEPLLQKLHEAALEPSLWNSALEALGDFVGRSSVSVLTSYHPEEGAHLLGSVRYDPENWKRVQAEHATPQTNRYIGMLNSARSGHVLWPRRILSSREWDEDPINRKFLKPDRLGDGLTVPIFQSSGAFLAVGLFRGSQYDEEDVGRLRACTGDIRRALTISRRLGELASAQGSALEALDHIPMAMLLVDINVRVKHANAAARSMLGRADGLVLGSEGRLLVSDRPGAATLERFVKGASVTSTQSHRRWSTSSARHRAGGMIALGRPSGGRPYSVLVAPLRTTEFLGVSVSWHSVAAVVFVSDPDLPHPVSSEVIADAHGLTRAEADLVARLVAGGGLAQAARAMGVSLNTAKTLLQRSFERTHTASQADLIRLILRGTAGLV